MRGVSLSGCQSRRGRRPSHHYTLLDAHAFRQRSGKAGQSEAGSRIRVGYVHPHLCISVRSARACVVSLRRHRGSVGTELLGILVMRPTPCAPCGNFIGLLAQSSALHALHALGHFTLGPLRRVSTWIFAGVNAGCRAPLCVPVTPVSLSLGVGVCPARPAKGEPISRGGSEFSWLVPGWYLGGPDVYRVHPRHNTRARTESLVHFSLAIVKIRA